MGKNVVEFSNDRETARYLLNLLVCHSRVVRIGNLTSFGVGRKLKGRMDDEQERVDDIYLDVHGKNIVSSDLKIVPHTFSFF